MVITRSKAPQSPQSPVEEENDDTISFDEEEEQPTIEETDITETEERILKKRKPKSRQLQPKERLINTLMDQKIGLPYVNRVFKQKKWKTGNEARDLKNLIDRYAEWMKTILPTRSFDDAIEMIESVSDSAAIRRYFEDIEQENISPIENEPKHQQDSSPESTPEKSKPSPDSTPEKNKSSPESTPEKDKSSPESTPEKNTESPKKQQSPINEQPLEEQIEIEGEEQWD